MRPTPLDDRTVGDALDAPDGPRWHLLGGKLVTTVTLTSFSNAVAFVRQVAELAEEVDHHPDIDIRYTQVTLALVTHDVGGITTLDLDLARAIDRLSVRGEGQE